MPRKLRNTTITAALAACLLAPATADAERRSYRPAAASGTVATFKLPKSVGARVARAHLKRGPWQYTLSASAVRRASRSSRIRVRVPSSLRRYAGRRMRKVRLVVDLRKSFSRKTNRAAGSAGTATKTATRPATPTRTRPTSGPASTVSGSDPKVAPGEPPVIPASTNGWRAPGAEPLSDADAAALVKPATEIIPENHDPNHCTPTDAELEAFNATRFSSGVNAGRLANVWMPTRPRVTGRFTGTTDEILQWAALKWGIPVDIARAVAHTESTWRQSTKGDRNTVADPNVFPAHSRISGNEVYESLGIMQIKWRPETQHPGTEPLRWRCTAFNADYWAATVRFYYDGLASSWFGASDGYGAGQEWQSIGGWFNPTPWNNGDMDKYIGWVKDRLADRAWERPGF